MPLISAKKTPRPYRKTAACEPIPGYTLIEPLGQGSFGEVWKCEGPGGLHKAIKFVFDKNESSISPSNGVRLEYQAFQQVKVIRHPFLLSVERLDLIGSNLAIVMELADGQLGDRFYECNAQGFSGIPREELIGYLLEAAEALDFIIAKHGLQHMDVKPANLFLIGGHALLGDYGLVSKLEVGTYCFGNRGFTPGYASPEAHQGKIHSRSDQYSLALVYHELLTGTLPFAGKTLEQFMEQHVSLPPDLSRLPERDRSALMRALSKQPEDRFPSCLAFIRALTVGSPSPASTSSFALITPAKKRLAVPDQQSKESLSEQTPAHDLRANTLVSPVPRATQKISPSPALPGGSSDPARLIPSAGSSPDPVRLIASAGSVIQSNAGVNTPLPAPSSTTESYGPFAFKLELIRSVFPVEHLLGRPSGETRCNAPEFVRKVVKAARAGGSKDSRLGEVIHLQDGSWACRFLSSIDPRVAKVKLNLLKDETGATIESPWGGRVVIRRPFKVPVKSTLFGISSMQELDSGLEVMVQLPKQGLGTAEILAKGKLYGSTPAEFEHVAKDAIVKLIEEIREQLNNIEERRESFRFPATFPVSVFPLHSDGRPDAPIQGRCKDVSEGGLSIIFTSKPLTRYIYVAFDRVAGIEGLAILVQIVRAEEHDKETLVSGRYRLDFGPEEPSK